MPLPHCLLLCPCSPPPPLRPQVGTGFEDFYDSAYWFGAASGFPDAILFQHAGSGLEHFSRGPPLGAAGAEQLSAYRFFDREVR